MQGQIKMIQMKNNAGFVIMCSPNENDSNEK